MLFFDMLRRPRPAVCALLQSMTGRRPQRVAYHLAPSCRGIATKWAAGFI